MGYSLTPKTQWKWYNLLFIGKLKTQNIFPCILWADLDALCAGFLFWRLWCCPEEESDRGWMVLFVFFWGRASAKERKRCRRRAKWKQKYMKWTFTRHWTLKELIAVLKANRMRWHHVLNMREWTYLICNILINALLKIHSY